METRHWCASLNQKPPKPDDFYVVGEVHALNPGVEVVLTFKEHQGINPERLLLDLHLVQQPGMWSQTLTWVRARYGSGICPDDIAYKDVEVFYENQRVAIIDVEIVS